ncbi:kinase [Micromonospora sp. CPCC 206060]|uniref:phosphotransferase-like protein n=1 Tax=Micromonospora sp. CPCC 206060 TaxID=3122406 RepID=UPI002FF41738
MRRGVILYGPPAAGKDTVTSVLQQLDGRFALFQRLKAGAGRCDGYRMTSHAELSRLRDQGDLIWENQRYESVYAVDRSGLSALLAEKVPVLHLGQIAAIDAVKQATPDTDWLVVGLWCPRDIAERRVIDRNTGDAAQRMRAWDETERPGGANLMFDTARTSAEQVASAILARVA